MQQKSEMQQGWDFATSVMGADLAAHMRMEYVSAVDDAIKEVEENINNHKYRNLGINQLQGYVLEEWGAGTFNVDAVAADSAYKAEVLHSTAKDSVDVLIKNGGQDAAAYSAKSYADGAKSAIEQARLNPDTRRVSYQGQGRLVPADQLSDAQAEAHRQALRNQLIRPEVSEAYAETEHKLTDTIKTDDGTKSRTATRKELEQIAKESKQQDFKASEHGVTAESAIRAKYLLKQALKPGYTAAAITVAVQLAPEIYKAIDYLIKHGELDIQQIKRMGTKGISAGAEGFLRGAVASSLKIMCDAGMLGEIFKGINPTVLGAVVALVMQTVKNSILVAAGKMSTQQMGAAFVDTVVVSGGYLLGFHIGGIIGQALGFELPVVGYLLGSLIGTSFCVIYNIGKKKLISFCIDTGFTCFGLVEQSYELPEDVLHEMGVETIPIPRAQVERVDVQRTQVRGTGIDTAEYETIDITVLRRGVIGVHKIGYVFQ